MSHYFLQIVRTSHRSPPPSLSYLLIGKTEETTASADTTSSSESTDKVVWALILLPLGSTPLDISGINGSSSSTGGGNGTALTHSSSFGGMKMVAKKDDFDMYGGSGGGGKGGKKGQKKGGPEVTGNTGGNGGGNTAKNVSSSINADQVQLVECSGYCDKERLGVSASQVKGEGRGEGGEEKRVYWVCQLPVSCVGLLTTTTIPLPSIIRHSSSDTPQEAVHQSLLGMMTVLTKLANGTYALLNLNVLLRLL